MKSKLAYKLALYFIAVLLMFAIVVGLAFYFLFTDYTMEHNKQDLGRRADQIAETFYGFLKTSSAEHSGCGWGEGVGNGYGAYLQFIDDIAMGDVWVVDQQLNQITSGHGNTVIEYRDLPDDAEDVIRTVFAGERALSESFSDILNVPTITAGAPIFDDFGDVVGAVLIHAPIEGVALAVKGGLDTLYISIFAAMLLSIGVSFLCSIRFTRPLRRMRNTALELGEGDYSAKTGVISADEIGELADAIDDMSTRLHNSALEGERMEQQRMEFIANISHELRTPVTVIRGSLEALCDGVVSDPEQVAEYHSQMLNESKQLERLVNDLLELSRLQDVGFAIEFTRIELSEVLQDVARGMRQIAAKKEVQIVTLVEAKESTIMGDYGRVRQMITIVMHNAIKFSDSGGRVTVRLTENLELYVIDEGCGIAPEDIEHIFDRFHKSQMERNREGTGLGLVIARQIALRHNIDMRIESEWEKGTKIMFTFTAQQ